ncbi:MAG: response regulator [Iphinoe sp. HA4291-MV1]|jgi:chemotaxis family two-component system response regulator PixG|nr:response regulator [Iphinoe sp. HA4291-MV1]
MQPGSPSFANITERLAVLSQQRATGELILSSGANQWHMYFFLGRLLYATGGVHRVRRWHRAVTQSCPGLKLDIPHLKEDELWEYHLLNWAINQNQLTLTQSKSIIEKIVQEVYFTVVGHSDLRSLWMPKKLHPIALLEVKQLLYTAFDLCKQWQSMGLGTLCPDMAPIFKQPIFEQNLKISKTIFSLSQLLNGENTIWDIALQTEQSVISVASVVQGLAHQGVLELLIVPDLPFPVGVTISVPSTKKQTQALDVSVGNGIQTSSSQYFSNPLTKTHSHLTPQLIEFTKAEKYNFVHSSQATHPQSTFDSPPIDLVQLKEAGCLIAYIDDSQSDSLIMGDILTKAGYRFINVQDPVTALPILLEHKPSLIFLDLVMPIANGYEICSRIRRVSTFRNTPVIILTNNDGIIDRVRAKIVGSSGFLAKPITTEKILKILKRYLPNSLPVHSQSLQTVQI